MTISRSQRLRRKATALWNTVVNPAAGYSGTLLDGLVSWFSLDETTGIRADSHGSNDLTDVNTVGNSAGKVGNASVFDAGSTEYFQSATGHGIGGGYADFTVAFWIYHYLYPASDGYAMADETPAADLNWNIWAAQELSGGVWLTFYIYTASSYVTVSNAAYLPFPGDNKWGFVIIYLDSTNGKIVLETTDWDLNQTSAETIDIDLANANSNNGKFHLGNGGGLGSPFDGTLDEVATWNRLLTSDEKAELLNGGAGMGYPG